MSFSIRACLKRFLPVGLMRSPIRIGSFLNSTMCVCEETQAMFFGKISKGWKSGSAATLFTKELMYFGVVPQHPPAIRAPFFKATKTSLGITVFTLKGDHEIVRAECYVPEKCAGADKCRKRKIPSNGTPLN